MSNIIQIPIKDSTEDAERLKSTTRFCIEIWNVTQKWCELSAKAEQAMERLINNRLRILYARNPVAGHDGGTVSTTTVDTASERLSVDERRRIMESIVGDVETIEGLFEDLARQQGKFAIAHGRLKPMRQLCEGNARCETMLIELEQIVTPIGKMYEMELRTKRAGLKDVGTMEHRDVFTAVLISYKYEPFVDKGLINRLYALVANGDL